MAATLGGCNADYQSKLTKQVPGTVDDSKLARAGMTKGGVNNLMAQSGKTSQGRAVNFRGTSGKSNGGPSSTTNPRMKLK